VSSKDASFLTSHVRWELGGDGIVKGDVNRKRVSVGTITYLSIGWTRGVDCVWGPRKSPGCGIGIIPWG